MAESDAVPQVVGGVAEVGADAGPGRGGVRAGET